MTVSLDDVVAARKAELGEAVAAAFKAPLASVSVEVATAAVTARLTSAEAEHKGYVIGDCVAVDRVAGELKPSAVVTLTMSDEDVTVRKSGQRLDPTEPKLYTGPELDAIKATVAELSAVKKEADENAATEAASLATRKAAFVAEKTATVEEGEEFDAEATEEEWTALLEEEAAAAAEAAKAAAAEEEAPAEPEEGEEGAEAPPAPLSLEELEALLARLVVRDEDSEAGITKCLGDYDSAVITAINVLKEVNSVSIDGLGMCPPRNPDHDLIARDISYRLLAVFSRSRGGLCAGPVPAQRHAFDPGACPGRHRAAGGVRRGGGRRGERKTCSLLLAACSLLLPGSRFPAPGSRFPIESTWKSLTRNNLLPPRPPARPGSPRPARPARCSQPTVAPCSPAATPGRRCTARLRW